MRLPVHSSVAAVLLFMIACAEPANDASPRAKLHDNGSARFSPESAASPFGELSGACGVLNQAVWDAHTPQWVANTLDFGGATFVTEHLTDGAQEVIADGNLNAGSLYSEAIAFEVLARCEGARLERTESEVEYLDPAGKKTDVLISIDQQRIGVSVTRAYAYPEGSHYTFEQASDLLERKLSDIPLAQENADPGNAWKRSMLSIIAFNAQHADQMHAAYGTISSGVRADVIVVVTTTDGEDAFIY